MKTESVELKLPSGGRVEIQLKGRTIQRLEWSGDASLISLKELDQAITQLIRDLGTGDTSIADTMRRFQVALRGDVDEPTSPRRLDPPRLAEFLLTALLKGSHADAATGDLNERFADECEKLGRRRAVWGYWARTLHSLGPLLFRAIGKAVKWGAVIDVVRRHF
jgi:hypothetical protein